jgi:hypothetical protein
MEAEDESGHFRIVFTGYRAATSAAEGTCAAADHGQAAWDTESDEDERAYFQADISWINLGVGEAPQSAALSAMITGDVRGMRKRAGPEETRSSGAGRSPLSLGTYALVAHKNAVAIGNPVIQGSPLRRQAITERESREYPRNPGARMIASARRHARDAGACVVDLPLSRPSRSRVIFLTYASANALSRLDQGYGRGVFPVAYRDPADAEREITLYFGIDRL